MLLFYLVHEIVLLGNNSMRGVPARLSVGLAFLIRGAQSLPLSEG